MAYPVALGEAIRDELDLDGRGRLLDVGCGPGSLTLLLAPYFAEAVGVDADGDMVEVAASRAAEQKLSNVKWQQLRAEELPGELGSFQSIARWHPMVTTAEGEGEEPGATRTLETSDGLRWAERLTQVDRRSGCTCTR